MHFRAWFREDSLESVDFGGSKNISLTAGVFLLINNAIGPGIAFLPIIYQQVGLLTCTLIILLLTFISYIISITVIESIHYIPDNEDFSLRIEYLDLIKYYLEPIESVKSNINNKKHSIFQSQLFSIISQILFYLFMISLLITNMIQTCHIMDMLIYQMFGASLGIQFYPQFVGIHGNCDDQNNPFNPFHTDSYILSIGTIIVMILILPFCLKDLHQILWMQSVSIYGLIIIILFMCILFPFSSTFITTSSQINLTNFNIDGIGNLLPINFFNFSFVCTVPSWFFEKEPNVSYNKVLKLTSIGIAFIIISIAIINALCFDYDYNSNENMLFEWIHFNSSSSSALTVDAISSLIGYFYPILQCLTSVPVYCIIIRYNLLNAECIRNVFVCNIMVIIIPFIISIILYHSDSYLYLMCWSGLFLSSFINFILPIYFYYIALTRPQEIWESITTSIHHQRQLQHTLSPTNTHRKSIKDRYSISSFNTANTTNTANDENIESEILSKDNVGLLHHETIEDYGAITPVTSSIDKYEQHPIINIDELKLDDTSLFSGDKIKNIMVITPRRSSHSLDEYKYPQTPTSWKQMDNYYIHGLSNMYNTRYTQHTQINKTMYDSPILNKTKTIYLLTCLIILFILSFALAICAVLS